MIGNQKYLISKNLRGSAFEYFFRLISCGNMNCVMCPSYQNPRMRAKLAAWKQHDRRWKNNRYVYAVVSRRSGGLSIGINLNPAKKCSFNCVYCQANRNVPPTATKVNLARLEAELELILQAEKDGSLYEMAPFSILAPAERGVRDIAFSGDGEPTMFARFKDAVTIAAKARRRFGLESSKLVLLTNSAHLSRPSVREGLAVLDENNGEVWAKLDAGSEEYFREINRSDVSLREVINNILDASRVRTVVIQSLWLRLKGAEPPVGEIEAYCDCLNRIMRSGGRIKAVQIHTIARYPAESFVSPLANKELDRVAEYVRGRVSLPVQVFYGA
jgi:wyosine [tRNA(Phe)-imidazoG37] synthetase (radical SAM superfamily)